MKKLFPLALLCAGLLFLSGCSSKPVGLTLPEIDGTWTPVELNENGKAVPEARLKNIEFVFGEGKFNRGETGGTGGSASVTASGLHTVSLDSKQNPTLIDLVSMQGENLGKTQPGILQMDGDKLKICLGPMGGDRPKEFTPGPKATYAVLKRK